jgi:hypothetical protein
VSRLTELRARRRRLLAECAQQRNALSSRFSELQAGPLTRAASELFARGPDGAGTLLRPLTWAAALVGLLLLRRPRQVLSVLGWARAAVSFGSRAALLLRFLGQLRSLRDARASGEGRRVSRARRARTAEH